MKKTSFILLLFTLASCFTEPKKDVITKKDEILNNYTPNTDTTLAIGIDDSLTVDNIDNQQVQEAVDTSLIFTPNWNEAEIKKIDELIELDYMNNLADLYRNSDGYIKELSFPSYTKKNGINVEIIINDYTIPVKDVNLKYINGNELAESDASLENYTGKHLVVFACKGGSENNCIYHNYSKKHSMALFQPLKNKEDCDELISILNEIKYILRR